MKTNPFARTYLKIRFAALCLAVVGLAGAGLALGGSLNTRFGLHTAWRAGASQAPNVGVAEAMATLQH